MEWLESRVLRRKLWAPGLATFTLDAAFDFTPGQFTNLGFDVGEKRVRRSYSIASPPGAPLEIYLTEVVGGELTPNLFSLSEGDTVFVQPRGAGVLTLEYVPDFARDLWLVSTGTGLAPFLSMLRSAVLFPRFDRAIFVHGVREVAQLGYADELAMAAAKDSRVTYVPLTSRQPPPSHGVSGRIPGAITSGALEERAGCLFDAQRSHIMLCGNPEMVRDATAALVARGLRKHRRREPGHITQEKYW